jgi:hypothetical protein
MRRIIFAIERGSFSSTSPQAVGSESDSRRLSSDRAKRVREINRSSRCPPHRGQTG